MNPQTNNVLKHRTFKKDGFEWAITVHEEPRGKIFTRRAELARSGETWAIIYKKHTGRLSYLIKPNKSVPVSVIREVERDLI